jgi:DNA ligase-associated metallophosphoesterase
MRNDTGDLQIEVAGEMLVLLPERALWWPARRTLIIADVHLGKSSVFRTHGLIVPGGSTADNLARLEACIHRHAATRLLCLGDLTHARASHTPQLSTQLGEFRDRHADLQIDLVCGNHDRHAGVPEALRVDVLEEPQAEMPFSLRHEPLRKDYADAFDAGYELAGHVHPAIVLSTQHDRLRLPCFVFGKHAGLLPAFGAFTGTHTLEMDASTRYYPVLEDRVLGPIPSQGKVTSVTTGSNFS